VCAFYLSAWGVIKDIQGNTIAFTLKDAVLFGSVLSSSDTVAAISVISEEEAPVLRCILLGEGVINDAVAIILFHSAVGLDMSTLNAGTIFMYVLEFIYICMSSIFVGMLFGFLSAVITRKFNQLNQHPSCEITLLFFLAYIGYMISFALKISCVISILTTSITMGHYTWHNISGEARVVSRGVFQIVGDGIEAFIFVYMGLASYEYYAKFSAYLFVLNYSLVVMFARFMGIVLVPGILKLCMKSSRLKWLELIIIWFAGSIRGAMGFALILTVTDSQNK
jgi:sodium/hydrogen exchanger-like protein 6/7